jgi:hypothetical protein
MAVVRNLLIRVGADYSAARQALQGATREVARFKRDTQKNLDEISGRRGLGQLNTQFRELSRSVSSSLSQIRGARGIGGVVTALGGLTPALSGAAASLRGLGAAAGGAAAALGPLGIGLGVVAAAAAAAIAAIAKASQPAVQFEADLMRLNMQLRGSSYEFMQWARSQGLAASTAANMGATYGTLLSSFISDTREIGRQTQDLVHATRVVASATGRTIEDVQERIRSGLLGNTEAIEDLGIFVNVAMIESTEAFRRFANGKHWNQLDFRVQQQIRLAAILEQAYARYGNELQQNVMTKQTLLTEQLKQIKLNLSQAFLPIWDAVLPALIRLAEALAVVTEELARFIYWLRGWDYDERTRGTQQYTDAVIDQGRAYDDLATSARKARGELAAFDRLNLIGFGSGVGGGTGGGGAGGGSQGGFTPGGGGRGRIDLPEFPPELTRRWRIEFDPPHPPDAGLGAVATAVVNTINGMIAETKARMAQWWADLQAQTATGLANVIIRWNQLATNLNEVLVPSMAAGVNLSWANMMNDLQVQTQAGTAAMNQQWSQMWQETLAQSQSNSMVLQENWRTTLANMLVSLVTFRPTVASEWAAVSNSVASVRVPLSQTNTAWNNSLTDMQTQLQTKRTAWDKVWDAVKVSLLLVKLQIQDVRNSWQSSLESMRKTANEKLSPIIAKIDEAIAAWNRFSAAFGMTGPARKENPLLDTEQWKRTFQTIFSGETARNIGDLLEREANKPENRAGLSIIGGLAGAGGAARGAAWLDDLLKQLKNIRIPVPQFASGGIVRGPTLAMIGEYAGASANPEVIAPLSELQEMVGDNDEEIIWLQRIVQAIRETANRPVTISRNDIGRASVDYMNDEIRRGRNPLHL